MGYDYIDLIRWFFEVFCERLDNRGIREIMEFVLRIILYFF